MAETANSVPAATIVVCDDEAPLRRLVTACLAGESRSVVEADDGDTAVQLALRLRPDLIILDMKMPGLSGREVLDAIRAAPELAHTRVLVLTGAFVTDGTTAADGYLSKPFRLGDLKAAVDDLLRAN